MAAILWSQVNLPAKPSVSVVAPVAYDDTNTSSTASPWKLPFGLLGMLGLTAGTLAVWWRSRWILRRRKQQQQQQQQQTPPAESETSDDGISSEFLDFVSAGGRRSPHSSSVDLQVTPQRTYSATPMAPLHDSDGKEIEVQFVDLLKNQIQRTVQRSPTDYINSGGDIAAVPGATPRETPDAASEEEVPQQLASAHVLQSSLEFVRKLHARLCRTEASLAANTNQLETKTSEIERLRDELDKARLDSQQPTPQHQDALVSELRARLSELEHQHGKHGEQSLAQRRLFECLESKLLILRESQPQDADLADVLNDTTTLIHETKHHSVPPELDIVYNHQKSSIDGLCRLVSSLRTELDTKVAKLAELGSERVEIQSALTTLKEKWKARAAELVDDNAELEALLAKKHAEVVAAEQEVQRVAVEVESLKSSQERTHETHSRLRSSLEDKLCNVDQSTKEIKALKRELKARDAHIRKLKLKLRLRVSSSASSDSSPEDNAADPSTTSTKSKTQVSVDATTDKIKASHKSPKKTLFASPTKVKQSPRKSPKPRSSSPRFSPRSRSYAEIQTKRMAIEEQSADISQRAFIFRTSG